jgi:hypothetical protein
MNVALSLPENFNSLWDFDSRVREDHRDPNHRTPAAEDLERHGADSVSAQRSGGVSEDGKARTARGKWTRVGRHLTSH